MTSDPIPDLTEPESLADATARAVAENADLACLIAGELRALGTRQVFTEPPLGRRGTVAREAVDVVLAAERELVVDLTGELEELARRLLEETDRFNIVLFGRTGTGKSSLVEALTHGSGTSISSGESDWTTSVQVVDWQSCRLADTPGIQGWGRTASRAELEERSRQALVTADIVLLCFDNQSQQAGEFRRVAEWIAEYGKPAIAVLNVRQGNWRFANRVPRRSMRVRMSQAVAEHALHIRGELAGTGLADSPVVALHAQRAVYARVPDGFEGPDTQQFVFRRQREEVGAPQLLAWSNLPALEQLMVSAIRAGAGRLRRDVLLNQTAATLDGMAGRTVAIEGQAVLVAKQAERGIEQLLQVLGAPEAYLDNGPQDAAALADLLERLHRLEVSREGGFEAPATGAAQRHGRSLVDAALAPVRSAAAARAEDLVDDAMLAGRLVDAAAFHEQVFDTAAVEAATARTVEQLTAYLTARIGLAAEDVLADLRAAELHAATVRGTAGRGYRSAALGVGAGTAAIGIGTGVAILMGPVGWTVLVGGLAAGLAGPPVRRWLRRRGAHRHEQELARARGAARQAVADTFDAVRDELIAWFMDAARRALVERFGAVVDEALLLRLVASTAATNRQTIRSSAAEIDQWADRAGDAGGTSRRTEATATLLAAVRACESAAGVTGPAARSLWLGESWLVDPTGLTDSVDGEDRADRADSGPGLGAVVRDRLATALTGMTEVPGQGAGQAWLAEVGRLLTDDPAAAPVLRDLYQALVDRTPRVLLFGDYNVGKSSFVKRLLVEDGRPVPETLAVSAGPQTSSVHEYEWSGFVLVDTPGLQSGQDGHASAARAELPDSTVVIYMLGGSGAVGDREGLDLVQRGDPDRGVQPAIDRTIFVVNRADELAVDPFVDGEGFARVVAAKERELRDALVASPELRAAGVRIAAERIVFVASDPRGRVGDERSVTAADFDEFRDWDGMDQLRAGFEELATALQANSPDVAVLHGGLARLGALAADARETADALRARLEQRDRLASELREIDESAEVIVSNVAAVLPRIVTEFIGLRIDQALQATGDQRSAVLGGTVHFWLDPELAQHIDAWSAHARDRVDEWERESWVVLQRRVHSRAFQRALGDDAVDEARPVSFPADVAPIGGIRAGGSMVARVIRRAEGMRAVRVFEAGSRDAHRIWMGGMADSLRMGERAGRHRAATVVESVLTRRRAATTAARIGRNANRLSGVVQVVTSVIELGRTFDEQRADRHQQEEFSRAVQALLDQAAAWATDLVDRDPTLVALREQRSIDAELLASTEADRLDDATELDGVTGRLAAYDEASRIGRVALHGGRPAVDGTVDATEGDR